MGKIQCVSSGRNSHNWEFIEKSLSNANSPLEKKIQTEYFFLKNSIEEERKNLYTLKNKITSKSKRKLISYISNKKKMERFIKWFKMSYSDLFSNSEYTVTISKETNTNKINRGNVNFLNDDKEIPNPNNNVNFDFSDIERSNNTHKFYYNDVIDKYFTNYNGISSIEYDENDIARDNVSESVNSLEGNVRSINQNNFISSFRLQERNDLVMMFIEKNIRKFYKNHSGRFLERVSKGPPESFRWLSWLICAEIPDDRKKEFFKKNYFDTVDEKTDIQIKKDLNRTMADITLTKSSSSDKINNDDPSSNYLYRVLRAFSNNDKEVSYCQGMNFIAGFILVASDFNETDTFYMLIALFSETFGTKFGIRGFFSENFPLLKAYIFIFHYFFQKKMPELKEHFGKLEIPDEVWISKWIQTLYTICLPIHTTLRLWDCMMSHGLEFLISFSIALVKHFETDLLKLTDSFEVIEFFKNIFTGKIENGNVVEIVKTDIKTIKGNNRLISNTNMNYLNVNRAKSDIKYEKNDGTNSTLHHNMDNYINLEDIISQAQKLKINKHTINIIKKEYESKFHVDLSYLHKIYDMSIAINYSVNTISELNSSSAKVSDLPDSKLSSRSQNLPQLVVPTVINTQLLNEKSTGITNVSQTNTNMVVIKENYENINLNQIHINCENDEDDDCVLSDNSIDCIEEVRVHNQIESHCFHAKSSIK